MKQSRKRVNNISSATQHNNKRGKSRQVNKMLLKQAKHLKGVESIEIYKYLEIMPIHDENEMRDWKKRLKTKVKETLSNDDPRIGCFNYPIHRYFKPHLANESWLQKHVVLGLRIREFINTEDPEIAVKTIKEYRDVLLYDGEEILICLLIIMSLREYQKFRSKLKKKGKPLWIPLFNPFKQELLRWRFLAKWGNYLEQKKAKDYLRRANVLVTTTYIKQIRNPSICLLNVLTIYLSNHFMPPYKS